MWVFVKQPPAWRPPDWTESWFPHEVQEGFDDLEGWQIITYGGLEADAMSSRLRPLHGRSNCRITYWDETGEGWLKLVPPEPVSIPDAFDTVQMWVYGNSYEAGKWTGVPRPTLVVRDAEGTIHKIEMESIGWIYWGISRVVPDVTIPAPAELLAIEIRDMPTRPHETKVIYLDCLSFYTESRAPVEIPDLGELSFPTRDETILPTVKDPGETSLARTDDGWVFRYDGADTELTYTYKPQTGTLSDITVRSTGENGPFKIAKGGGARVVLGDREYPPGDDALEATLVDERRDGDAVVATWALAAGGETATITYKIWLWQKSLVVDVSGDDRKVSAFFAGDTELGGVKELWVPYLTYNTTETPNPETGPPVAQTVRYTDGIFLSRCWDWYNANATSIADAQNVSYRPITDGSLNPLHERMFYTVSTDFHEVLPNIPNPPARFGKELGSQLYTSNMPIPDRIPELLPRWQRLKRYGVDHVLVKHHTDVWSHSLARGMKPGFLAEHVNEDFPGGDEGMAKYIDDVRSLGYGFALYTNYVGIQPISRHWDEQYLTMNSDRNWRHYWVQAYCLSPMIVPHFASEIAPRIKKRFGNNAAYYDGATANRVWNYVDFDARKPGAGQYGAVFRAVGKALLEEATAYQGPVMSEGLQHFFAGLNEGNYGVLRVPPEVDPIDLLKLHPLQSNLGMGFISRKNFHRYVCASLAHGRSPWTGGDLARADPSSPGTSPVWYYFMTQQASANYAMVPVRTIAYYDGAELIGPTEAVRGETYKRNQVFVEYENGLRLFANGNFDENWTVTESGADYILPPAGWLIHMPGTLLEYSALVAGHRADFVDSPEYLYVNGLGTRTDFGPVVATGGVNVKKAGESHLEVIPMETEQTLTFRPAELLDSQRRYRVSVLDFDRNVLRESTIEPGVKELILTFGPGEFSAEIVADR